MKQCMKDLRDGWYGNDAYHKWCAADRPKTVEGTVDGEALTDDERRTAAKARFGKKKTEDDWIPRDCHRPVNCGGLVKKAIAEANAVIEKIDGLSGTLDNLVVQDGAKILEAAVIDCSDMTGLPAEMMLVGNDIVLNEDGTVATDDVVQPQDEDAEMEAEEPTANAEGQPRSWPSASIETGGEEDQRVAAIRCICCNKSMGSDTDHLVCEECGGGF
jgi:hypothetical protein